ncbi:hypothetical protein NHX12_026315 [Muraenolepis orangiensis]|uniref:Uncharacterized protein n=1 Tax=Muraenolepis orangiensis TaxID=630683 RepID=A0A9Q0EJB5_9TELE|nr:hypothetical protein NHX12_026315 [Muraenolepis orangiensis]
MASNSRSNPPFYYLKWNISANTLSPPARRQGRRAWEDSLALPGSQWSGTNENIASTAAIRGHPPGPMLSPKPSTRRPAGARLS